MVEVVLGVADVRDSTRSTAASRRVPSKDKGSISSAEEGGNDFNGEKVRRGDRNELPVLDMAGTRGELQLARLDRERTPKIRADRGGLCE
jgi:hypothetical protein